MMSLTDRASHFMHLLWQSEWDAMRQMVTAEFKYENRPSENLVLPFEGMVEVNRSFIDGRNGWSVVEQGHHSVLNTVEYGNNVAHERMDMWKANGRWYRLPCAGFWTFDGELITRWNDYFDMQRVQSYKAGTLPGDDAAWAA